MMKCPRCSGTKWRKMGYGFRGGKKYPRYQCSNCGATHVEGAKRPDWLIKEQRASYG